MTVFLNALLDASLFVVGGAILFGVCDLAGRMLLRYCEERKHKNTPRHHRRGA